MQDMSNVAIGKRLEEAYHASADYGTWGAFVAAMALEKGMNDEIKGANPESVRNFRSGEWAAGVQFLLAASRVLDVRYQWLITGEEPMREDEGVRLLRGEEFESREEVVLVPIWKTGIDRHRLSLDNWKDQERRFNAVFAERKLAYNQLTPLVKAMLGNVAARRIKAEKDSRRREDPAYRGRIVGDLMEFLQLGLERKGIGGRLFAPMKPTDRAYTDYAIGALYSLAVSMPERPK